MSDENLHPTKTLTAPDGGIVEVDVMLAPVIEEIWRAEIDTVSCCQDAADLGAEFLQARPHLAARAQYNAGYAYVDFPDEDDAAAFLDAVANAGPRDDFYERMTHWAAPGAWRKHAHFWDVGRLESDDDEGYASDFRLGSAQICFPISDIDEIVRRLQRYNEGLAPAF